MTGIALGAALLVAAAFGWLGATVVAVAVAAVLAAGGSGGRRRVAAPAIAVLVAAAIGLWRGGGAGVLGPSEPAVAGAIPAWVDAAEGVRGRVATPPRATGTRQSFELALGAVRPGSPPGASSAWETTSGIVCASAPAYPVLRLDDPVRLKGDLVPVADLAGGLRGAFASRGCRATLFATWAALDEEPTDAARAAPATVRRWAAAAQTRLTAAFRGALPGDAGSLAAGLVTGDDHALSGPRRAAFLRTGTTHVTAVSGANVALVVAAATALARAGGWRRRLAWQLPTLAAIWAYALLTGLGSPVARAALVATGVVLAARTGRRPDLVTLTVLAAAAMVAAEPDQLRQVSFQLSFASALALVAVFAGSEPAGVAGWATALLKASVAAQVATLPVVLATFGQLALVSLPANLVVGPLVGLTYPLAAIAGPVALAAPTLGGAALVPSGLGAAAIIAVVDALGGSERTVWVIGRTSTVATAGLTLLVVVLIGGMSSEVRAAARRSAADWRAISGERRWAMLSAGLGISLAALAFALAARR